MTKLEAAKAALIRKVRATKSLSMIKHLDTSLSLASDEWWDTLPNPIKQALIESDAQIERGETVPHEEVMKRARRWANR